MTKVFNVMHSFQKSVSVSDVSAETYIMEYRLDFELQKLTDRNILNLEPSGKNGVSHFMPSISELTSKVITKEYILHCSIENMMIDSKLLRYLYFDKILATYRFDPTV